MARVKGGYTKRRRHKKVLKQAEGFYGLRRKSYVIASQTVTRAMKFAFRDRKVKKRTFRTLWIERLNAAARNLGLNYSSFAGALKKHKVDLDRRTLADLAICDPKAFETVVNTIRA